MPTTRALWHFARGLAHTAKGDRKSAEGERKAFRAVAAKVPAGFRWGQSSARTVLQVAEGLLDGRLELADGDRKAAIASLQRAAEVEDTLRYNEPPDWYLPVRESLGAALLAEGKVQT
jgi:hypothetical protein